MGISRSLIFLSILMLLSHGSIALRPRGLVLPVMKNASTNQYFTHLKQRTPFVQINLNIDLGSPYMVVNCENYISSSYTWPRYTSPLCRTAFGASRHYCNLPASPSCHNDSCIVYIDNPFTPFVISGALIQDAVSIPSTDGSSVVAPHIAFLCDTFLYDQPAFANGATGMIGLGRTQTGLPLQFAAAFSFPKKFAMCLPSSTAGRGVIVFGNSPLPGIQLSRLLAYTPLYINPISAYWSRERSTEYFIGVKSIKIGNRGVPINNTMLSIDGNGWGGTVISTRNRFTQFESSIYRAFVSVFLQQARGRNISRVPPFDVCFNAKNGLGISVPDIEVSLDGKDQPIWTISASNSMVRVNESIACLGFVDGGVDPVERAAVVIGGHQLEDNLVEFDIARSRVGFSSSLLRHGTSCSNFNFTSTS